MQKSLFRACRSTSRAGPSCRRAVQPLRTLIVEKRDPTTTAAPTPAMGAGQPLRRGPDAAPGSALAGNVSVETTRGRAGARTGRPRSNHRRGTAAAATARRTSSPEHDEGAQVTMTFGRDRQPSANTWISEHYYTRRGSAVATSKKKDEVPGSTQNLGCGGEGRSRRPVDPAGRYPGTDAATRARDRPGRPGRPRRRRRNAAKAVLHDLLHDRPDPARLPGTRHDTPRTARRSPWSAPAAEHEVVRRPVSPSLASLVIECVLGLPASADEDRQSPTRTQRRLPPPGRARRPAGTQFEGGRSLSCRLAVRRAEDSNRPRPTYSSSAAGAGWSSPSRLTLGRRPLPRRRTWTLAYARNDTRARWRT